MAKVFFSKALVANPLIIDGAPVAFELLDRNKGVIALDTNDPSKAKLITGLMECATKGQGGVELISEAQYNEKKNLLPFSGTFRREHEQPLRTMPGHNRNPSRDEAAVVADITKHPLFQATLEAAVAKAIAEKAAPAPAAPVAPSTPTAPAPEPAPEPAAEPAPVVTPEPVAPPAAATDPVAALQAEPSVRPTPRRIAPRQPKPTDQNAAA